MPAFFSNYTAKLILDNLFAVGSGAQITPPTTYHFALFVDDTGLRENTIGTATELSGTGYVRKAITTGSGFSTVVADAPAMSTDNTTIVDWGAAGSEWGDIEYVALMDSSTLGAGNVWAYAALTEGLIHINSGDSMKYAIGDFNVLL